MACNRHKNACQESWRIYQNIQHFSNNLLFRTIRINKVDYLYNLSNNIIKMNGTLYNIQWEGKCLIIVSNNRNKIDTLPSTSKLTKLAITSYLACLVKKGSRANLLSLSTICSRVLPNSQKPWMLWNTLDTNIFLFLLSIFLDFICLFLFLFFSDNEEAHDITITWHVTWYDIINLEHSRRIWKMMSEHIYTI